MESHYDGTDDNDKPSAENSFDVEAIYLGESRYRAIVSFHLVQLWVLI
jgi:hypothetical protein